MPEPIDILLVSPGTTAGWRQADAALEAGLRAAGASVVVARPDFRVARHLRRGMLATDIAEAAAARRATDQALRHHTPRAFVFSTVQAAMLQPRDRVVRSAVRFDAPPSLNRRGAGGAPSRRLGERALQRARVLLPYGLEPSPQLALPGNATVVALPVPLDAPEPSAQRSADLVAYAGNPEKKGLDTIMRAWAGVPSGGSRLIVTGIDEQAGRAWLDTRGVAVPASVVWRGSLDPTEFKRLLAGSLAFVSASRYEDYGQAQLEALAAGSLLVTTASEGPYEALGLARKLDPSLIADRDGPAALAASIEAALTMSAAERADYRGRARALTTPYSATELQRRLTERVLPPLMAGL